MQSHCAVVTSFNAPTATITFFIIYHYHARLLRLLERVSWARGYAWGGAAESARYRDVDQWMNAHRADS
jgi:hypothetical protein